MVYPHKSRRLNDRDYATLMAARMGLIQGSRGIESLSGSTFISTTRTRWWIGTKNVTYMVNKLLQLGHLKLKSNGELE